MNNTRFRTYVNTYEEGKKKELATLANSNKSYNEILIYLKNEIDKSTTMTNFSYHLTCFREDGAYQLNKAVEEIYGASINKGEKTPSNGENPIEMIDVKLSNGNRVKVPFGRIDTPDLGKGAYINVYYDFDTNLLFIEGVCQFRYASIIDTIVNRTEVLLNTDSIYKNQAIEINSDFLPKSLDLSNIDKEFMVLSTQTEFDLQPLRARILKPQECISKNISLKYGCLMEGPYGLIN